ncbi:unnamed protein product [Rhizophagus irregularis]|uniref:Uncharacterized protein n=1 Tax=Rhizophagus irregularis TaxID=588596 RepID=A0A916ECI3_9GLOM|nr:unnamed protein product [Rhizophagus irregularis]
MVIFMVHSRQRCYLWKGLTKLTVFRLRANAFNIFTINSNSNRPAVAHTTDPIISLADETPALSSQSVQSQDF